MNPLVRLGLLIASQPVFSIKKNYQFVRKAQEALTNLPEKDNLEDFILLDHYLPAKDDPYQVPVRVFIPRNELESGLIIFFHGGGFVTGNLDTYTHPCLKLATQTGRMVCSVDYRLAPEFLFPTALEDCLAVTEEIITYLEENPSENHNFHPITIMGDSAGANLATTVTRELSHSLPGVVDLEVLLYPAIGYDYSPESPFLSLKEKGEGFGLTTQNMRDYYDLYLPRPELIKDPRVSPLLATDLAGLPPTLLFTAEHDPLRDEGEYYADLLRQEGVPCENRRIPDVPHGFFSHNNFFTEETDAMLRQITAFINAWQPQ